MNDSLPFNFCTTSSADSLTLFSYRTTLSIVCTYVHVPDVIPNKKFLYHWPCGKLVSLTEKTSSQLITQLKNWISWDWISSLQRAQNLTKVGLFGVAVRLLLRWMCVLVSLPIVDNTQNYFFSYKICSYFILMMISFRRGFKIFCLFGIGAGGSRVLSKSFANIQKKKFHTLWEQRPIKEIWEKKFMNILSTRVRGW